MVNLDILPNHVYSSFSDCYLFYLLHSMFRVFMMLSVSWILVPVCFNGVLYVYCCKPEYIKEKVWKLPICLTKILAFSIYWNWINISCSHLSNFRFCYLLSTLHPFPLKSFTETLTDIFCFVLKIDNIILPSPALGPFAGYWRNIPNFRT